MAPLAFMDGVWRGPAWTILPSGEKHNITQTERIGPFLDGSIKVIEGRGYNADGTVGSTRSAPSRTTRPPGFTLCTLMRKATSVTLRLTARLTVTSGKFPPGDDNSLHGCHQRMAHGSKSVIRIMPGKEPVRFFEMNLKRVGDTNWPAAGTISPK